MTLSFACPECGKNYRNVKPELIGKKARCSCGHVIRIGQAGPAANQDYGQVDLQADATEQKLETSKPKKNLVPTVTVQVNKNLIVDDHYSDLDELLAGNGYDEVAQFVEAPRTEIAVPAGLVETPVVSNSLSKSSLALMAAIASATIAFWFGLLVVLARFTEFDQILLAYFGQTYAGINSASFGNEEMTTGLKLGFVAIGWSMWIVGAAMLLLAVGQLLNALMQLFLHRQLLRWVDGMMATLSIVFVFLIVGSLFLHASHMMKLNRELNKVAPAATADEFVPPNVKRIREQYAQRNKTFTMVMLISGTVPLSVFVFSIVRMFTTAGDSNVRLPRKDREKSFNR